MPGNIITALSPERTSMGNLTTFQLGILVAFVAAALVGVVLFALGVGSGSDEAVGEVVLWGTLDQDIMDSVLTQIRESDNRYAEIIYVEKDPRTYDAEFVDALASGRGPDLFLLPQSSLFLHQDKLTYIPYETFSQRNFKNTFTEAGEVYLSSTGAAGLPLLIDPLVMYWNRDIFADAALAEPPRYWDEFPTMSPRVTQRDQSSNILRSFVAFGEFRNVVNAKDILATLMLQTGNPIVFKSETGQVRSVLSSSFDYLIPPAEAALRFYTEFSDPVKAVYSWNRALPDSRQSFLGQDLGLYFGFASENLRLQSGNPNLNFDVTVIPQPRDSDRRITFANVLAVSIARGAKNPTGAAQVMFVLTAPEQARAFASQTGLPPARRDLLGAVPLDPAQAVFYESAIASRSWLDPNDAETDGIFQRMVESFLSGRLRLNEAIQTADKEIGLLLVR